MVSVLQDCAKMAVSSAYNAKDVFGGGGAYQQGTK
jgi:hypothetical protein